jgi:hypothetical protein
MGTLQITLTLLALFTNLHTTTCPCHNTPVM